MAPATMTEPNSVSNEEDNSRQRNVPTSLVFRNPESTENVLDTHNFTQGVDPHNNENADDSTGTCTPRTPISNPLKTFRSVRKSLRSLDCFTSDLIQIYSNAKTCYLH